MRAPVIMGHRMSGDCGTRLTPISWSPDTVTQSDRVGICPIADMAKQRIDHLDQEITKKRES